jgi:hypothetical protein
MSMKNSFFPASQLVEFCPVSVYDFINEKEIAKERR